MANATPASTDPRHQRLASFVAFVREHLSGDEKGEAQTYLDRLFRAFGQPGAIEAGAVYEDRVRRAKQKTIGFADLVWGEIVLFEMKKRGEPLARHAQQMLDYWIGLAGRRPAYCVLCNFDELWVYDFNSEITAPVDRVMLDDLPERYGPLAFLFPTGERPVFQDDHEAVTREAADHLAGVFKSLKRRGVDASEAQRFILQLLVALFAEDIDLLERYFLTRLLEECRQNPSHSYDLLGGLFHAMNTPGGVSSGRYKGVKYFNGGLFAEPVSIELLPGEIDELTTASHNDWSKVRPEIFGTIFEQTMDGDQRHAFGAHFTSQLDIYKIVNPTIVEPWEAAIERAARGKEPLKALRAVRERMQAFRVLDPACGSGNFLYIAYRAMKRLEARLFEAQDEVSTEKDKTQREMSFVTARQFFGMDINPFAVELAKVTLMIARKLAIDELHIQENPLPLANLDANFRTVDALITFPEDGSDPVRTPWPRADVVIGNPPFLGAKRLKPERGADYVNAVRKLYPDVPGMADYCVYWFRRAHDHVLPATKEDPLRGRVGLVGTQNVRNNKSREGGLDHVVQSGIILDAVDNQPWSGEANVHVSIANWVKVEGEPGAVDERALLLPGERRLWVKAEAERQTGVTNRKRGERQDKTYQLVMRSASHINSALSDRSNVGLAKALRCVVDPQRSFQGVKLGYKGFSLTHKERRVLIEADGANAEVARPWLIGRDLLTGDGRPSRAVIDFADMDLLAAARYDKPFALLKQRVLTEVEAKANAAKSGEFEGARGDHLDRWWQFWNVRHDMREAFATSERYIACSQVTKRPIFVFIGTGVCPDATLQVFAFDDDYSFGVLSSSAHWEWFVAKCSKLTERFRYTRRSVWDTFPWPQSPSKADVLAVAQAGRAIRAIRDEHLPKTKGGLRALYRTLELPGKSPLKDAHAALDAAVLKAYGFSPKKDLLAQLLALNLAVAAKEKAGEAVTAPGVPGSFIEAGGDAGALVTGDCVRAG